MIRQRQGHGLMAMAAVSALIVTLLATPYPARAQELNLATLDDTQANHVFVRTGAEYGFVAGAGYARSVRLLDRVLLLYGDVTMPWAGLDVSDYRVRAGALAPIALSRRWRLSGAVAPTLRGTKNELGRMTGIGVDLGVTGGFYARHWFLASELGFDWVMTTHVSPSGSYRSNVYADARDGWYSSSAGNLRYGLQAGASFGRHGLVLRGGQLRDIGGSSPLLPFYATLTYGVRW